MSRFADLAGVRFGELVVESRGESAGYHVRWWCVCDCGERKQVRSAHLLQGLTRSCGCLQKRVARANAKHGHLAGYKQSPEYATWRAMLRRCHDEKHSDFKVYGGRGIIVCQKWQDSFQSFFDDVGARPDGTTLDRIEQSGNYEPGNVRWATPKEQARNMRSNRMLTLNGVTKCTAEWADCLGIPQNTLRSRLFQGWSDERALTTPHKSLRKQD